MPICFRKVSPDTKSGGFCTPLAVGVVLFRRIGDARFRRVVLAVLLFAGVLLVA